MALPTKKSFGANGSRERWPVKALFDTNILIDYLSGLEAARQEIELYRDRAISVITWMEVMVGTAPEHETGTRALLASLQNLPITPAVAEAAVLLRKERKLKLPDAIILATAQTADRLLITRNTRDFPRSDATVRIPYRR